jgi:hypothetical protein
MKRTRLRLTRLAAALGLVSALWACNAPFIPVPPPGASFTSEAVADGAGGMKTVWVTTGAPYPQAAMARFYIYDVQHATGVIALAAADGTYRAPALDGTAGDQVEIFYETPTGQPSPLFCVLLLEGPDLAPACR